MTVINRQRAKLVVIVFVLLTGVAVATLGDTNQNAAAHLRQARAKLAYLHLVAHNTAVLNSALPRVNADRKPTESWRVACSRDLFKQFRHSNAAVPVRAPEWLRSPRDDGPPTHTSFLMVYKENSQPDLTRSPVPWGIAEVPRSGIDWTESRDMTVKQFVAWAEARLERGEEVLFIDRFGRMGTLTDTRAYFYGMTDELVERFLVNE